MFFRKRPKMQKPPPPGFEHVSVSIYSSNQASFVAAVSKPAKNAGTLATSTHPAPPNLAPPTISAAPKPHTCRNCGLIGHLYRDCPHPTMSFGLICYRVFEGKLQYLMIQRKDSLSFMEFIRGKYHISQIDYIKRLLGAMTPSEREALLTRPFEALWNYVWYQASMPKHTTEFMESRRKYEQLRTGFLHTNAAGGGSTWITLQELIVQSPTPFKEPEWGFPKGRRRLREDDVDCAVREFCEETGYKSGDVVLLPRSTPFEEIFYGTNNVLYRHVYYLAHLRGTAGSIHPIDPKNLNQAREVRAIAWFSYEETLEHIRAHNHERRQLFQEAHTRIVEELKDRRR